MLKYIISIWISVVVLGSYAQDSIPMQDSLKIKQKYGFRLGLDLSRPLMQVVQKQDIGFEITGDYRVAKNWYVATEIGYESEPGDEEFLEFHTQGSYAKVGFNYNAYENWQGVNNEVYVGMRYGYSIFQQHLKSYTTPDLNNYFGSQNYNPNEVFNGLNGHWAEINVGLKVEVLSNLFLTAGVQFKKLLGSNQPDGFSNLYIPGFNKVLLYNNGFGFNYTIAYSIPFYKK